MQSVENHTWKILPLTNTYILLVLLRLSKRKIVPQNNIRGFLRTDYGYILKLNIELEGLDCNNILDVCILEDMRAQTTKNWDLVGVHYMLWYTLKKKRNRRMAKACTLHLNSHVDFKLLRIHCETLINLDKWSIWYNTFILLLQKFVVFNVNFVKLF